jgi:type IV pilus assembly protein PilX
MAHHRRDPGSSGQSGVVLITGLIFMVMLTLIVLAGLRTGSLEERMAANARNRQLALQAAEAVLRDAEVSLFAGPLALPFDPFMPTSFTSACTTGYCDKSAGNSKWKTANWTDTGVTRSFAPGANAFSLDAKLAASPPRYFLEAVFDSLVFNKLCNPPVYRMSARGVGQDSSQVYVQTMYLSPTPEFCPLGSPTPGSTFGT